VPTNRGSRLKVKLSKTEPREKMPHKQVETYEALTRRALDGDTAAVILWLQRFGGLGWALPPSLSRH
jgi:hypothetical protein